MLSEDLENGVKAAFLARMPKGLADYGHVLRAANETFAVPEGDEQAPMVVVRFFDGAKQGTRLWKVPYEVRLMWNVDASGDTAAKAMLAGLVERFHEVPGDGVVGWLVELNAKLADLAVVRWWVAVVKNSDPVDREKSRVITGHVWVGER